MFDVPFLGNQTAAFRCEQLYGVDYSRDVTYKFCLEAMFLFVFLVAIVQYFRISRRDPVKSITPQKLFHLLLALVNFVQLATIPIPFTVYEKMNNFEQFIIQALPGALYFSSYMLLFLYWASAYYRAVRLHDTEFQRTVLWIYLGTNALAYMALFGLASYMERTNASYNRVVNYVGVYIGFLSGSVALLALAYGILVGCRLRSYPVVSSFGKITMRQVGAVTVVCIVSFLIKSPAAILMDRYLCNRTVKYENYQIISSLYLLVVDIIPALLVLYIVRKPPSASLRRRAKRKSIATISTSHHRNYGSTSPSPQTTFRYGVEDVNPLYLGFGGMMSSSPVTSHPSSSAHSPVHGDEAVSPKTPTLIL